MTRPLVGLVAAGLAVAAQESGAQLAVVPPPFVVERANAAAEFTVAFQLGEEGPSQLVVEFDELDAAHQPTRDYSLSLDFDPFEGARFRWSVGADAALRIPSESAALTSYAEPRGLRYELRVTLPVGRGIEVALGDGTPLLVATTPRAPAIGVHFKTSGSVLGLTASAPRSLTPPQLAEAFAKLPAPPAGANLPPPRSERPANHESWALVSLTPAAEPPAAVELHPLDERSAPEGAIERLLLEPADVVQVPAIVVKGPHADGEASEARRRAYLVVASGARGKNDPAALAQVAMQARGGALVVAVDLLGCGERLRFQAHDPLTTYELLLVGHSAGEYAAREIRQLLAWVAQRPDVDPAQVDLWADATTQAVLQRAGAVAGITIGTGTNRSAASSELADAAVFSEDEVRLRYDSWLLEQLFELRDQVATPDRSLPLLQRLGPPEGRPAAPTDALLTWNATAGARFVTDAADLPHASGPLILCASDLGPRAAIDQALRARTPAKGSTWVALDDGPVGDDPLDPGGLLERRVGRVLAAMTRLAGDAQAPRKLQLFGEGSCGVVLLLAATQRPDLVGSVTALRAIPSFGLLLQRDPEAARAAPPLGVLTQGLPAELFVANALARFELEECVLDLREHGIAVEWLDPVDALRRPLSRHDRLAMWPRVRRLEPAR